MYSTKFSPGVFLRSSYYIGEQCGLCESYVLFVSVESYLKKRLG
jgi:hypothetical protein